MTATALAANGTGVKPVYPRRVRRHQLDFLRLGRAALFHADHDLRVRALFRQFRRAESGNGAGDVGLCRRGAGLTIALLSPVLGAIADASGRRKPWIAGFGALLVIGASAMWIGKPGDPSVILPLLLAYAVASVGVEFATVFNNAMMPTLVPPERIGRLSGTGWATGYVGGIVA